MIPVSLTRSNLEYVCLFSSFYLSIILNSLYLVSDLSTYLLSSIYTIFLTHHLFFCLCVCVHVRVCSSQVYKASWFIDSTPSEQEPFNPGTWTVIYSTCVRSCLFGCVHVGGGRKLSKPEFLNDPNLDFTALFTFSTLTLFCFSAEVCSGDCLAKHPYSGVYANATNHFIIG